MPRSSLLVVVTVPVLAAAQSAPVAAPPAPAIPPPVVITPSPNFEAALITWTPGPVTCEGEAVAPDLMPQPLAGIGALPDARATEESQRFTFAVDASGRVTDLNAEDSAKYIPHGGDLVPSLAAARFPAGRARTGCSISYTRASRAIAEAELKELVRYTVFPAGRPPQAVWDRIRPAGSNCLETPPPPLTRAFPDFAKIPQAPGTLAWTLVGYDIDASGRTTAIRAVAGSGNEILDREARNAVARSTFVEGERRGCLYPYWRRGGLLPAPAAPDLASYRPAAATCPDKLPWAREPRLSFPEPFRRRGIEGWAVVSYDVAPWGELGNMRVLAAQPAAAFGDAAMGVLRGASKPPSERGATGCVDRVRFVTGAEGAGRVGAEGPLPLS